MKRLNLLWIVVLILIPIVYSGGTGDLGNEKAKVKYTFDSKETCIGKQCTLTIGGQEYSDENGTLLENTKSLKTCQFCNNIKLDIQEDKTNFPVRVTDYNYSKMKVCFSAGLTQTGKNIPLEIYNKYNTSQKTLTTTVKLLTIFNENCQELDFGFDKEMKWGDASTIISINSTNNGILQNLALKQGVNNASYQFKINISQLPINKHIDIATFCGKIEEYDTGSIPLDYDTYIYRVKNYTWSESSTLQKLNNLTLDNLTTTELLTSVTGYGISCVNVTTQINADYNENKINSSFRVIDQDYMVFKKITSFEQNFILFGNLGDSYFSLFPRTYVTSSYRPYVNIIYSDTIISIPFETNCSYNGTGNKMFRCNCMINKSINFLNKNVTINGSGRFVIRSNFTNFKNFWIGTKPTDKCNLSIENGGKLL